MPNSVLFVCLGNICRSPACEGICKSVTKGAVRAESAGSCGYHVGEPPDERTQRVCRENGIDISTKRARQIRLDDWTKFTVIAALDHSIRSDLEKLRPPGATAKLVLFNAPGGIEDPYFGKIEGFRRMFQTIAKAMQPFLAEPGLVERRPQ
jgi:protein-tyrosine phosphatase